MQLQPHQQKVVDHMENHSSLLVAHDTGTGKTLIAIACAVDFIEKNPTAFVFFVTPKSLVENMKKEFRAYTGENPKANYNFFTHHGFGSEFSHSYERMKGNMILVDEAHNFRTPIPKKANKPTKAKVLVECCKRAEKVMLFTATPVINDPYEIANLKAMLEQTSSVRRKIQLGTIHKDEDSMKAFYKNSVSTFYPNKTEGYPKVEKEAVRLTMPPPYFEKYTMIEQSLLPTFHVKNPFPFYSGLRMACNGIEEKSSKVDWTIAKIMEGERIVIYSFFKTYGIYLVQKELENGGIEYREIVGDMSIKERKEAMEEYNNGTINVFFITKAGGEGLDLKTTRYIVKFEPSWSEKVEEQIEGRAIRYGSHADLPEEQRIVTVYDLIHIKPVDNGMQAADIVLKELIEKKAFVVNRYMRVLKNVSIERVNGNEGEDKTDLLPLVPFGEKKTAYDLFIDLTEHRKEGMTFTLSTGLATRYLSNHSFKNTFMRVHGIPDENLANLRYCKVPTLKPECDLYFNALNLVGNFFCKPTDDLVDFTLAVARYSDKFLMDYYEYKGIKVEGNVFKVEWERKGKEIEPAELEETEDENVQCSVCLTYKKTHILGCGHSFCYECVKTIFESSKQCGYCKTQITNIIKMYG